MRKEVVTEPTIEALSLAAVKEHLGVTGSDSDGRIYPLIKAARHEFENYTNSILVTSTWDAHYDYFEDLFELPGPITEALTHIKYYDSDNAQQTLGSAYYDTDFKSNPARVMLASGYTWPSTYDRMNAVTIRFVAGYLSAAAVPEDIKQGLLCHISGLYDEREELIKIAEAFWSHARWWPI